MNCSRFETLLSDYMDRALDPLVRQVVDEHARNCARCAELLLEVRTLREDLSQFPVLETPAGLIDRIRERTSGKRRVRSLWADLILPTIEPFLTQRYAYATAMMFVFFSLVANVLGPEFSGRSYSDLKPANIVDEADRVSGQIYKKWIEFNNAKNRFIAEIKLLKEDLYGRLDYHLITILFKSYRESLREQEQKSKEKK